MNRFCACSAFSEIAGLRLCVQALIPVSSVPMNPVSMPTAWAPVHAAETAPDAARGVKAPVSSQGPVWTLQRRCALSPTQFACGLGLAALACVSVSAGFWWLGAAWVSVFAGLECLVVGIAFAVHAAHAADGERLWLRGGRLHVERRCGWRLDQRDFDLARVQLLNTEAAGIELRDRDGAWSVGALASAHRRKQVWTELLRTRADLQRGSQADESSWS